MERFSEYELGGNVLIDRHVKDQFFNLAIPLKNANLVNLELNNALRLLEIIALQDFATPNSTCINDLALCLVPSTLCNQSHFAFLRI